ncbi:MAG: T9SS type A sorting domain-containing protein, partial [Bacteroidetes bacterium]|nr:T9SS type A sorting domain-containing protein [Bacteroidota bacterium]
INQFGQRIFVTQVNQPLMQINVSSFAKGIYYVKICTGKKGEIAKLVKM